MTYNIDFYESNTIKDRIEQIDLRACEPTEIELLIIKTLTEIDIDCSKSQALVKIRDVLNTWSDKINYMIL